MRDLLRPSRARGPQGLGKGLGRGPTAADTVETFTLCGSPGYIRGKTAKKDLLESNFAPRCGIEADASGLDRRKTMAKSEKPAKSAAKEVKPASKESKAAPAKTADKGAAKKKK